MGSEQQCQVRFGKQKSKGKALLETSEVIFRGDFRLRIPFKNIHSVEVTGESLRLRTDDGDALFELGAKAAAKWREKILNPKSRTDKLGIQADAQVTLIGFAATEEDQEFFDEIGQRTKHVTKNSVKPGTEWIFLKVATLDQLAQVSRVRKSMRDAMALWIIFPKGKPKEPGRVTEANVFSVGRASGLTDIKVVGFSATHTALKFVIPLSARD